MAGVITLGCNTGVTLSAGTATMITFGDAAISATAYFMSGIVACRELGEIAKKNGTLSGIGYLSEDPYQPSFF